MKIELFGFTIKVYRGKDTLDVQGLIRSSEGMQRYIKQLEMALDERKKPDEDIRCPLSHRIRASYQAEGGHVRLYWCDECLKGYQRDDVTIREGARHEPDR